MLKQTMKSIFLSHSVNIKTKDNSSIFSSVFMHVIDIYSI